jgi:alpha-beta hydrolase superfamily lysophospholipase
MPYLAARPATQSPAMPAGVVHRGGTFHRGDIEFFEQSWRPEGPVRAVLVVIHGFKDHGARYEEVALRMVGAGFAVYAMDQRGHGRSAGLRTTIDSYADLVSDLAVFMERVRAAEPGRPLFLFGHSMGGVVVTLYALDHQAELAGLLLSAPALRIDRMPLEVAAIGITAALTPDLPLLDLPNVDFSRDPKVVAGIDEDPLIHSAPGPARTVAALADAISRIWERARTLELPLLAMHGTGDSLTDPRGSADLVREAASRDKTLKLYPGLVHDLLHEPEREQLLTDVASWLAARVPAADALPAEP